MILKITALCVATAMICSTLRLQRPELATGLSLAAGVAVLAMLLGNLEDISGWFAWLKGIKQTDDGLISAVIRGAGIALIAELGAQLCSDAGENALAGRVRLAARVAMLGICAPLIGELAGMLNGLVP